jgi:hypothetical protein
MAFFTVTVADAQALVRTSPLVAMKRASLRHALPDVATVISIPTEAKPATTATDAQGMAVQRNAKLSSVLNVLTTTRRMLNRVVKAPAQSVYNYRLRIVISTVPIKLLGTQIFFITVQYQSVARRFIAFQTRVVAHKVRAVRVRAMTQRNCV